MRDFSATKKRRKERGKQEGAKFIRNGICHHLKIWKQSLNVKAERRVQHEKLQQQSV